MDIPEGIHSKHVLDMKPHNNGDEPKVNANLMFDLTGFILGLREHFSWFWNVLQGICDASCT